MNLAGRSQELSEQEAGLQSKHKCVKREACLDIRSKHGSKERTWKQEASLEARSKTEDRQHASKERSEL